MKILKQLPILVITITPLRIKKKETGEVDFSIFCIKNDFFSTFIKIKIKNFKCPFITQKNMKYLESNTIYR